MNDENTVEGGAMNEAGFAAGMDLRDDADEIIPALAGPGGARWHGQLRRVGSARELPGPQQYRDYPVWLTAPNKNPALELTA